MAGIHVLVHSDEMVHQAQLIAQREALNIAEIRRIATQDAVTEARNSVARGASIIIARGYQASLIKQYTNVPVVEICLTAQELGILFSQAKRVVDKAVPVIAIAGFRNMFCDMTHFNQIFNINCRTYLADNVKELQEQIQHCVNDRPDVIIGGDTVITAAEKAGIPAIFLSSTEESLEMAFRTAAQIYTVTDTEKRNNAQMETLLDYSFNGIMRLNRQGKITVVNYVMEEILHSKSDKLIGEDVRKVLPGIESEDLENVLSSGIGITSTFIKVKDTALVVVVAPIKIDDETDGAILSCHRVKQMEKNESDLIRERYLKGYIANINFEDIKTVSRSMENCLKNARIFAQSSNPVLIAGEKGTEVYSLSQAIHNNSLASSGPFVQINPSGMTEEEQEELLFGNGRRPEAADYTPGALGLANKGSLAIMDIENLSLHNQKRLYRAITNHSLLRYDVERVSSIEVRLIASTSADLYELVENGSFDVELYYLLKALSVHIPPLRQRIEDLEKIIEDYIKFYVRSYHRFHVMSEDAMQLLISQKWPGNRVQLQSFCERMILSANKRNITAAYVQSLLSELFPESPSVENVPDGDNFKSREAAAVAEALKKHGGNRSKAAEELGISKTTLWRHMKKYGIENEYRF